MPSVFHAALKLTERVEEAKTKGLHRLAEGITVQLLNHKNLKVKLNREHYMPARGYKFYLRVCNILITMFLSTFRRFPTTFRRFPKIFQNCSEGLTNVSEHFRTFSEDCRW